MSDDIMGRKRSHGHLVGIRLLPDSYVPQSVNTHQLENAQIIGTIFIGIEGTYCAQLRRTIKHLLFNVPKSFHFLNSSGWPFDISLEDKILVTECLNLNVVSIQKNNGKLSRIGIKFIGGQILGFIFLSYNYEVTQIRNLIMSELGDQFENDETFEFIENNSWPVRKSQENSLSVWDLVVHNCITIVKKKFKRSIDHDDDKSDHKIKLRKTSHLETISKEDDLNSHNILISYVHGEASTYARDLKNELLNLGFKKIFLDVDDIAAGQDWQDVISSALNTCSIFIPLVTPRYGETRWTNREAKLADDKEKVIIPVSFLNKWPPDQLAIQFLALQYIPWKTTEELNGGSFSGFTESIWGRKSVQRVANEIKKICYEPEVSTPDSVSLLDVRNLRSASRFTLQLGERQRNRLNGRENDRIIISAHCKQKLLVEKITKMFEAEKFQVWSSMIMSECDDLAFSPLEDTQPMICSPSVESVGIHSAPLLMGTMEHSTSNVKKLKNDFKCRVKEAKLVVLIFSEDYLKSRICRQQLYYCEQRKKAIVIKDGDFQIDSIILNLYPEHEMISSENWESLKFKAKEKLKADLEDYYKSNIMLSVSKLKNVVDTDMTVYVIGGTDKISKDAHDFCLFLGNELGKLEHLNLATEGFLGAGDLVGKNFCEEQEIRNKGQPTKIYHIIPVKDSSDYSDKARQRPDGAFEKVPYGTTLYYGMSVSNRDDIVAAAFKLCILIEGGERSACLAEKFLWNDCTVIPVLYNNNAIKYKQCLKESITKVPNSVNENDWTNLNRQGCSLEDRAISVKNIVCALLDLKH